MHRCLLILVVPLSLMFHTACSSETELSSSNSSSNGNNLLPNDHSTDESSSSKDGDVVLEPVMINGSFLTCSLSEDNVTLTCQGSLDQEEMESIVFLDDDGSIDFTVSSLESNKFQIVLAREANQDSLVVQPEKKYIVLWDVEYYQGYHIKIDVTDLQVGEELTWDNLIIDSNFPDDQWFSDNSLDSVKVPDGYQIELYESPYFNKSGAYVVSNSDVPHLGFFGLQNEVTSIRITKE